MQIPLERFFTEPPITGPSLKHVLWHPDGERLTYLITPEGAESPELWSCSLAGGEHALLVRGAELPAPPGEKRPTLEGCRWFPSGERLLLGQEGAYWSYDLEAGRMELLLEDADPQAEPHFSPCGGRIAFVRRGNLWIRDLAAGAERALTTDGGDDVLNGKLDWVSWEELGHRRRWRAFEWSPDGEKLALLSLDQSRVPVYPLVDARKVHPALTRQRYPKAGDPNALPSVRVLAAADGRLLARAAPEEGAYAGPELAWTPDSRAAAWTRLARDQRLLELRLLGPDGEQCLLREQDAHWLNHLGPPFFLPDGSGFLWISERSGRAHLYRHAADGSDPAALTAGEWQVERLLAVRGERAFVTGTGEDPRERHLYRVALDGSGTERLTPPGGVHAAELPRSGKWILLTSESPEAPAESHLLHEDGRPRRVIHGPDPGWREYEWAGSEQMEVAAGDGTLLHGRLLRPRELEAGRRYPVVVHVYGGPHAQTVRMDWTGRDVLDQLLVQAGILVWRLDNRGTWGRGHAFETPVSRRLGAVELEDQLAGVRRLCSLPWVDAERIGITGWSYGGYMTLYALTRAPETFRCGAAGAPVTDWRLYDSIYTERYMGTPAENAEGYRAASILEAADRLQAPLLLVHGTDDDNVHPQHTLQLLEALARHRKPYELILQPGQKHGFQGAEARTYVYERLLAFFRRHLLPG